MRMYELLCDKYIIEQLIGNGTYGAVFRAKEIRCDRTVAIKALHRERYDANTLRYLEGEIRVMGRLWGHPNIISIHTVEPGDEDYLAYLVMEYVDGPNLRRIMTSGPLPEQTIVRIILDVCRALQYAHDRNIIHRDVKPQNILLAPGLTAKLSDFGVARVLEQTDDYVGTVAGTRKYMAPEQYAHSYDYRVDLYATGLILYELLTGTFPFEGHSSADVERQKCSQDPPIPSTISGPFRPILERSLARDPQQRYASAQEFAEDLLKLRELQYRQDVHKLMKQQQSKGLRNAGLASRRAEWNFSPAEAALIEREVADEIASEQLRRELADLARQTQEHYMRAREQLSKGLTQQALTVLCKLVALHVSDEDASHLIRDLFVRLLDHELESSSWDVERLRDQIQILPEAERHQLLRSLGVRTLPETSNVHLDEIAEQNPVLRINEPRMRDLERKIKHYQNRAEDYVRSNNLNRARKYYKKVGDLYSEMSEILTKHSQRLEPISYCHMLAALAYSDAAKLGSKFAQWKSRRCYFRAGETETKIANAYDEKRHWQEAGAHYCKAARYYESAARKGERERTYRQAVKAYLTLAQELFIEQANHERRDVELAREACQTAINVGRHLQQRCDLVEEAKGLYEDIISFLELRR